MPWVKVKESTAAEREALDRNYRGRARFLVDESIGQTVADILKDWGYNTRYAANEGLLGRSDEDVFASAWKAKAANESWEARRYVTTTSRHHVTQSQFLHRFLSPYSDQTSPGKFHGHVRAWSQLTPEMQNALKNAGLTDARGNIFR